VVLAGCYVLICSLNDPLIFGIKASFHCQVIFFVGVYSILFGS
jgi:hypothetical protein